MDTIYALASAQGRAGVSVIRVSGPTAHDVCFGLCGDVPALRQASVRVLRDHSGLHLDEALVLVFPHGGSFTGEAVVEFHLHGSLAVISAVLRTLSEFPDCRAAEAGEFTRRALENGRLDLAQVEGLADLIDSETEAQRRQALRVLSGALGQQAEHWRRDLIRAAALLEATIDFADEDVPVDVTPEVEALLHGVHVALQRESDGVKTAERIRHGFEVAIIGAPNVGKSTLLNALAGREAAITSEYAGTTRDVIEVRMDLNGLPVTLLDTAGLRETEDFVEGIGIARAKERAGQADLRVFLVEGDEKPSFAYAEDDIILRAKADLLADKRGAVSGMSGEGVDSLVQQITEKLSMRADSRGLATRERHRVAILQAVKGIEMAFEHLKQGPDVYDLAAEDIRSATRALESLVGRVDVEDLLDEIFSSFCLGK